jgi:hypothetical protein
MSDLYWNKKKYPPEEGWGIHNGMLMQRIKSKNIQEAILQTYQVLLEYAGTNTKMDFIFPDSCESDLRREARFIKNLCLLGDEHKDFEDLLKKLDPDN